MTEYTWSQTAATNANADASINWAEGQSPGSVNNSARAMMAARSKARDDAAGVGPSNAVISTAGTSTAYTVTSNQTITALTHGFSITFRAHATNTGTATIAVDGLAAKPLRAKTAVELGANDLLIGHTYTATYFQPTDEWLLKVSPVPARSVTFAQIEEIATDTVLGRDTAGSGSIEELTLGTTLAISGGALGVPDDGITFAKIQNIATDRVLGRDTASDGDIEQLTLGSGLAISGGALNTAGGMELIETMTASGSGALTTATLSSTYHTFLFRFVNIRPSVNDAAFMARINDGGGVETSGYVSRVAYWNTAGTNFVSETDGIYFTSSTANHGVGSDATDARLSGEARYSPHTGLRNAMTGQVGFTSAGEGPSIAITTGYFDTNVAATAVQFRFDSGNIDTGTIYVYGIRA
jgi:hypothetical protein